MDPSERPLHDGFETIDTPADGPVLSLIPTYDVMEQLLSSEILMEYTPEQRFAAVDVVLPSSHV